MEKPLPSDAPMEETPALSLSRLHTQTWNSVEDKLLASICQEEKNLVDVFSLRRERPSEPSSIPLNKQRRSHNPVIMRKVTQQLQERSLRQQWEWRPHQSTHAGECHDRRM